MSEHNENSWIGVDLDGTLAFYDMWRGADHIGEPIPEMLNRVNEWLSEGKQVKIFTARADTPENIPYVEEWCKNYIGKILPVTNVKDQNMVELWDDRAKQVIPNTGKLIGEEVGMEKRLVLRYNQVSAEALGFGFKQLTTDVARNLSSLLTGISSFVGESVKPLAAHLRFDFKGDDGVEKLLAKTNYIALSPVMIYVPAGMNVDMVSFLSTLEDTQDILGKLNEEVLKPSKLYFSNLLATPETMGSVRNDDMVRRVKTYLDSLEKSSKETSKCYSKHNYANKREHGDVFKRNSDWKVACDKLTDITSSYNNFTPKQIWEEVNEICAVLDRLVIRMTQSPEVYKPTGITSGDLADLTFYVGKVIEFYAAYSYILQMTSAAMRDNVGIYKEVLKD